MLIYSWNYIRISYLLDLALNLYLNICMIYWAPPEFYYFRVEQHSYVCYCLVKRHFILDGLRTCSKKAGKNNFNQIFSPLPFDVSQKSSRHYFFCHVQVHCVLVFIIMKALVRGITLWRRVRISLPLLRCAHVVSWCTVCLKMQPKLEWLNGTWVIFGHYIVILDLKYFLTYHPLSHGFEAGTWNKDFSQFQLSKIF